MDRCNSYRRMKRRYEHETEFEERTLFKEDPSLDEIRSALRVATESHANIIRLAALMDNLAMYHAPVVLPGGDDCARTSGIRKVLSADGYLLSRYSSLMRYKNLAEDIRRFAGVDISANLLWGLAPQCPEDVENYPGSDYDVLRDLYASFRGMNFKQIKEKVRNANGKDEF